MNIIMMLQNVGVVIRVINEIKRPHWSNRVYALV